MTGWATCSAEDVADVIRNLGHPEIAERMMEDEIDGEALNLFTYHHFEDYGLKKGPAVKLQAQLTQMAGDPSIVATRGIGVPPAQTQSHHSQPRYSQQQAVDVHYDAHYASDDLNYNYDSEAFINHWGLDQRAQETLLGLDPRLQQRVMNQFAPQDVSKGASAVFTSFVKSVVGTGGGHIPNGGYHSYDRHTMNYNDHYNGGGSFGAMPTATGDASIDEFIATWGLDAKAQEELLRLDHIAQRRVMREFSPKEFSNASKMFMSFARSVAGTATQMATAGAMTGDYEVDSFVARWGLDSISQEQLLRLDLDTRRRVMHGFAPPEYSKANKMFMGFLKSVATTSAAYSGTSTGVSSYGISPHPTGDMSIDSFVAKFNLDNIAQEHLMSLSPDVQQRVMQDFKPTDMNKASRIFMGFVRNVRTGQNAPAGTPLSDTQGYGASPNYTGDHHIDNFVNQWGLDSKAQSVLLALDHPTQQRVIREFSPPSSENTSRAFMGFVKNVQATPHRTSQMGFGEGGGHGSCAAPAPPPPPPPPGAAFGGGGTFGETAAPTGDPDIDAFVARWGLDSKAQDALVQLDRASLSRVIADFNPQDVSRASRMLMAFVRGVASGGSSKGKGRFSPY